MVDLRKQTSLRLISISYVILFCGTSVMSAKPELNLKEVKCQVCKATVQEVESAINKVDPKKFVEVGYRLKSDGSTSSKKVPYAKSETYLTEMLESICDKMDDYARAKYKSNGKLTVLRLVTESGSMNPEASKVDFVQDEDLNKSLKHYCLEVLEDNEDAVLQMYMQENGVKDAEYELCTKEAGYCNDVPFEDDDDDYYNYTLEEDALRDEL